MITAGSRFQGVARATGPIVPTDPLWASVGLLMHMDGLNGESAFVDLKGHAIAATGTPITSNEQVKYGTASAKFNGSNYLTVPADSIFNLNNGDFTVEFSFYLTAFGAAGYSHLVGSANPGNGVGGWGIRAEATQLVIYGNGNSQGNYVTTIALNTWYTVSLVRIGTGANCTALYLNGSPIAASGTGAGNPSFGTSTGPLYIGMHPSSPTGGTVGFIDELRHTNAGRYSGAYTVATQPFPSPIIQLGNVWDTTFNTGSVVYGSGGADAAGAGNSWCKSVNMMNSGRVRFDVRLNSFGGSLRPMIGIVPIAGTGSYGSANAINIWLFDSVTWYLDRAGVDTIFGSFSFALGDKLGMLVDFDALTVTVLKNGIQVGPVITGLVPGTYKAMAGSPGGGYTFNVTTFF